VGLTIVYDKADMAVPLGRRKYTTWAAHDLTAFEGLMERTFSRTRPQQSPTVEKLANLLGNGEMSRPDAAKALGMSTATLQRRLSMAGTSFRELSRDIRRRKLVSLLSTDGRLDDIAAELGWSDRRSLWRSCHEWLGASPSQFRAGLRSSPS
jgi:AraC-like DNA-binding protein